MYTPLCRVSFVDFEQLNVSWECLFNYILQRNLNFGNSIITSCLCKLLIFHLKKHSAYCIEYWSSGHTWLCEELKIGNVLQTKDKESGWTALHRSVYYGHIDCAVYLFKVCVFHFQNIVIQASFNRDT